MFTVEKNKKSTIVFGDIHGLTYWKDVVNENPMCRYIFLGDYLDPYQNISPQQLLENLKEIIQFKKEHFDDVILLLGNHDLHYFCPKMPMSCRFEYDIAGEVAVLFNENINLFTYAFQEENYIFTHAGISEQWFLKDFKGDRNKNIAEQLNNPLPEQVSALYRCGAARGGYYNTIGGIFWADINELEHPLTGYTQVVGHNRVRDIYEHSNNGGKIIFCDCLFNKKYLVIGLSEKS